MTDCLFCDIVAGEEPAHRVYEGEHTLAFLDVTPANRGHVLVAPTSHRETLTDLEDDLAAALFRTVREVATAVEAAFEPDGLNVVQSNGPAAGQEIPHVHVHVVPRYEDDGMAVHWMPEKVTDESQRQVADALREAL